MSVQDFKELVDIVKGRVDLVSLISEDTRLTAHGSIHTGRIAPPSRENGAKNQSLVVWSETQTWHDFSQGFGGDCFSWLQRSRKLGFREAVFTLAARAGVSLPDETNEQWKAELEALHQKRRVQHVLTSAASYYNRKLPREMEEAWFHKRYGLTEQTVKDLQLGWADGNLWYHLTEEVGYTRDEALASGLFVVTDAGTVHDFFQNRLVFPYWRAGNVVYFIARQTELTASTKWEESKYKKLLTHNERHPYVSEHISNEWFYNEDAAFGAEEVLITEGVTDCISARQCGIPCISPVTVRFRKSDVPKLLELTKRCRRIVICNDNEENNAGEKGARDTAEALWNEGRDIRIARIPRPEGRDKIDLNELVAEQGADALKKVLASARTWPEYIAEQIPTDTPPGDLDNQLEPVFDCLTKTPAITVDAVLSSLGKRFGLSKKVLQDSLKAAHRRVKKSEPKPELNDDEIPCVKCNSRQMIDIVQDTVRVLVPANRKLIETRTISAEMPLLFKRFGRLTQMRDDGHGGLKLIDCNESSVFGVLIRSAKWIYVNEDGIRDAKPPTEICRDILSFPPEGVPTIEGIIYTPVFGKDGNILTEPGYQSSDSAWLHIDAYLGKLEVPEAPTTEQISQALGLFFDDVLIDFDFVSESDRAHMLSAILLPLVRRMVNGPTPLHVVEAPSVGSGKSLLANVANIIASGREAEMTTLSHEEEEVRKQLTAELINAGPLLVLDNAREGKQMASESLAAALTSRVWKTRILGRSDMIELQNNATWFLTGNNVTMSTELARRSVRIRIDPGVPKAWRRSGFKHPNLLLWVKENRRSLVTAALTLIQSWIAAGCPRFTEDRLGSFEDWSSVMGGILETIGVRGMLGNQQDLNSAADEESRMMEHFVQCWWDQYRNREMLVGDLQEMCQRMELLEDKIVDESAIGRTRRLGRLLSMNKDRIFLHFKIRAAGYDRKGRAQFQLDDVSGSEKLLPAPTVTDSADPACWPSMNQLRAPEPPAELLLPDPQYTPELDEDDPFYIP